MQDLHHRLGDLLAMAERHLPSLLISADQLARVRPIAEVLPVFAVDFFGFECRLAGAGGGVDCAANLTPDGARMLAGRHALAPPAELREGPWERLRTFYQAWGDTRTPAYVDAPATWLEFDTSDMLAHPNLLFGYWPNTTIVRRPMAWLVDDIIPLLLGRPMAPGFRDNLERCILAAPPGTRDFQIGLMFSRAVQAVRLCIFDLPPDRLFSYLEAVGWDGPADLLGEYLEALAPHADFVGLHLDVGERIYPQIGVEPNFAAGCWTRQPHREPRWHGQFDSLMQRGLVTAAERDALLSWVGHQRFKSGAKEQLLLRGLSHLKVVLRPDRRPLAKAYFGIAQREMGAEASDAA
jgi:hypothetical protein